MKLKLFLLFIVFQTFVFADDVAAIRRADNIPEEILDKNDDEYFEGYLQALVDMHYYEYKVVVMVKDGNVWLANMPKNAMYADSIVSFLKEVPLYPYLRELLFLCCCKSPLLLLLCLRISLLLRNRLLSRTSRPLLFCMPSSAQNI